MSDLLQRSAEGIQERMDEILANFKPGAKITVLVRTPDKPTADFCMTDDNLWEATTMLQRRMVDAGYPVVSSEPLAFISQKAFGQLIADRSGEFLMTVPRDKPGPMEVALFTWPTPVPEADPPAPVWRPIAEADNGIAYIHALGPIKVGNSYPIWARDADGRVFECLWADDGKQAYWWDIEGESPVDPVEFMPHPLASPTVGGEE